MSYETCETCKGGGVICATCKLPRDNDRESRQFSPHRSCQRKPRGIIYCPSHQPWRVRCDFCGVKADCVDVPRRGGGYDHNGPEGWTRSWSTHHSDICPKCTTDFAVAQDAVGGLDMSLLGDKAALKLIEALGRLDPYKIERPLRLQLHDVLKMALGRFEDYQRRERPRHEELDNH